MSDNPFDTWPEWALKVTLIAIAGFAVSHLKEIGTQTASLSSQFLELKYEIKRLAENQIEMNSQFARQLEKIESRVTEIERRRKND
jgi:TolA-binding protein